MDNENFFEMAEQALRQSWEVHRQAFGPILEPAFTDNQEARVHLINALNHISRREVTRGLEILNQIKNSCVCDEDKAAWVFFVGLGFEMAGKKEQSLKWYADAGEYNHRFYLPYLKLARAAHAISDFEKAKGYYEKSIECLLETADSEANRIILGSVYTNMTSCLTMLHQYDAAKIAWEKSKDYPAQPGADATAAILYAAMGNKKKTAEHIKKLEESCPAWLEPTRVMTRQILEGIHPAFPPQEKTK